MLCRLRDGEGRPPALQPEPPDYRSESPTKTEGIIRNADLTPIPVLVWRQRNADPLSPSVAVTAFVQRIPNMVNDTAKRIS